MTAELTGLCQDHSFETAEDLCRRCGLEFCELCLVYPFGAKRPLCKECAMVAGGVRSQGARPEMAKREVRRRIKAWDARAKRSAGGPTGEGDPILNDPLAPTTGDLDRVPVSTPAFDDGAATAAALSEAFNEPTSAEYANAVSSAGTASSGSSESSVPASNESGEQPADGVAPPIDWSQPFG